MGTPDFARRPLEYLHNSSRHEIAAVVTGPDMPSGRGLNLIPTAVKSAAQALVLPVLTPAKLKDAAFQDEIKEFEADIFVVVAFKILPESLFSIPKSGSINLHGSLLPKYRGAAPINWVLINGETETGLTTFFLKKKVDTGNIIYQEKISIGPEEIFDELYARMSERAGPVIEKTLDLIETGKVNLNTQDDSKATPAPKIMPFDAMIDWGFPPQNVINFIRGLSSVPGAYTAFRGKRLKIFRAKKIDIAPEKAARPGQIIRDKHKLIAAVAEGAVEILELQPEGKGRITGEQFLRGYHPDDNDILGAKLEGN